LLAQFAVMAEIYSRKVLHTTNPRVGILSIGEEEHKGNELTRATWPLLKSLNINFIGNVEGGDIYAGEVDVIVCDGFIGNVALKVSEGLVDMFKKLLRESLEAGAAEAGWRPVLASASLQLPAAAFVPVPDTEDGTASDLNLLEPQKERTDEGVRLVRGWLGKRLFTGAVARRRTCVLQTRARWCRGRYTRVHPRPCRR